MTSGKQEVLSPQEHLTGSTVGVLIEGVHLEVVLIGRRSLWFDVGAGAEESQFYNTSL